MTKQLHHRRTLAMQIGIVFVIVFGLWWSQDRGLKAVAAETHSALCSFKNDLEVRRDSQQGYLDAMQGREIFGIPREVIEQSVRNISATLDSLEELSC